MPKTRAIVAALMVVGLLAGGEALSVERADTDVERATRPAASTPSLTLTRAVAAVRPQLEGSAPARAVVAAPGSSSATPPSSTPSATYQQDPAAHHWAVLIGINDYAGSTEDAIGSRQDAKELRKILLRRGWRSSNIKMLLDRKATAKAIVKAVNWLARNTTSESRVIFHYAGHEMPFYSDRDGDGERRDVALWAADNQFVVDGHLGQLLGKVRARRMWVHFATCRAGGFDDPGIAKRNRVVTYSSPEHELSYEDPEVGHSVFGYYSIIRAIRHKQGDLNGNGKISVEEAFRFARDPVIKRTSGRQHPLIKDRLEGGFRLKVPAPKSDPPPPQAPPEEPDNCIGLICP